MNSWAPTTCQAPRCEHERQQRVMVMPRVTLGECWDWMGRGFAEKRALNKDLGGWGGGYMDRHVGKSALGNGTCKDPGGKASLGMFKEQ